MNRNVRFQIFDESNQFTSLNATLTVRHGDRTTVALHQRTCDPKRPQQQQDNAMTPITRRELFLIITAVAAGCRAAPRSAIVTLAVEGMI